MNLVVFEDLVHYVRIRGGQRASLVEAGRLEHDEASDGPASVVEQWAGMTDTSVGREALKTLEVSLAVELAPCEALLAIASDECIEGHARMLPHAQRPSERGRVCAPPSRVSR